MTIQDTFSFAAEAIAHALGEPIVYRRGAFDPVTVDAVIGSGFQRVESGEIRVSSTKPEMMVPNSVFEEFEMAPEDARGDHIEIISSELHFTVVNVRPDIEGVSSVLVLKLEG